MKVKVLTEEGEALEYEFWSEYRDRGCSCWTGCAPCSYCTHPGHPISLECTDELWEEIEVFDIDDLVKNAQNAVREVVELKATAIMAVMEWEAMLLETKVHGRMIRMYEDFGVDFKE